MAAQRVQHYLDIHKIGPIFEDLMAALIKDMPNEPMPYLIRTLQKADQKLRSPRGTLADRSKSASTPGLHKYGMGVTGHSAPKRSIEEPHMALPGGKSAGAVWNSTNLSKSHERPMSADPKKKLYEKPWLSGSRGTKPTSSEPRKAERPATGKNKSEWNKDTKSKAKNVDDLFNSKEASHANTLKSQNVERSNLAQYEGVKTWATGEENAPPNIIIQGGTSAKIAGTGKEEIDVKDIAMGTSSDRMEVDSPVTPTKSKKHKATSQAADKKLKLQALLSDDKKDSNVIENGDYDSGDDESLEVLEQADDLEGEGVENPVMTGAKLSKSYRSRDEDSKVQIKICARCAKVISTGQLGAGFSDTDSESPPKMRAAFSDITASEEDFESVSQVGIGAPREQKWPTIKDRDGSPSQQQHMYSSAPIDSDAPMTDRDFFKDNAPMRVKPPPQKPGMYYSDTESESQVFQTGPRDVAGGRAWAVKPAETGSEAESDFLS